MRHALKWIATLAVSALCTLTFAVQPPEAFSESNYLLLKGGTYTPQSNDMKNFDTGFNGEVVGGHFFNSFLGAELGVGYFESSDGPDKLTVYPVTLAGRLRIPIPVVKPYAIAGMGAYFAKSERSGVGSQSDSDTTFGYFAGAGVDFKVLFVLLNIEAKYLWAQPSFFGKDVNIDGVVVTAGVGLEF